jgi:hypothetical protein
MGGASAVAPGDVNGWLNGRRGHGPTAERPALVLPWFKSLLPARIGSMALRFVLCGGRSVAGVTGFFLAGGLRGRTAVETSGRRAGGAVGVARDGGAPRRPLVKNSSTFAGLAQLILWSIVSCRGLVLR